MSRQDAPIGISLVFFAQSLGGSIFLAIGQTVFSSVVRSDLSKIAGVNADAVYNAGATNIRRMVTSEQLPAVLQAYNHAVTRTFAVGAATAAAGFAAAAVIEWRSVKKEKDQLSGSLGPQGRAGKKVGQV
jgi:hypothetical protein